jgi:hypothetical protein
MSIATSNLVVGGTLNVAGNCIFNGNLITIPYSNLSLIWPTPSTSITTGTFVLTNGGAGIYGNTNIGGIITTTNTAAATSVSTGAIVCGGGIGVAGNAYIGGNIIITNNTAAINATTGVLVVTGGVGVGGNAFVGGNLSVSGNTIHTGSTTNTGGILGGGNIVTTNAAHATSAITGALIVGGGVGVTGNVYAGGNIVTTNATASTSTTTGALIVSGGAGVAGNIYMGGALYTNNVAVGTILTSVGTVSVTPNTAGNITTISLTTGVWVVTGRFVFIANPTEYVFCSISPSIIDDNLCSLTVVNFQSYIYPTNSLTRIISVSSTQTIYFKGGYGQFNPSSLNCQVNGSAVKIA